MTIEVTKTFKREVPAQRFVGKRYGLADMQNGAFGHLWTEWINSGRFETLFALGPSAANDAGYIGLMRMKTEAASFEFEYWIGLFFAADTAVPEGFDSVDLPEGTVGVAWLHGQEPEIYGDKACSACWTAVETAFLVKMKDIDSWQVSFELYNNLRFVEKEADGSCTLDYGFYVE